MTEHIIKLNPPQASVLVVDDEAPVCETYYQILTRAGHVVHTAHSYQEATAILRDEALDAIVSDIFLGDKDGLDLLEQSYKCDPDTPVILITGLPTIETASAAVRLKAYEYLPKPVPLEKLTDTVARAIKFKSLCVAKKRIEIQNRNYQRDLEQLVEARTKKLDESNQRFQLLFENSKDAIYMEAWNKRFLALNQSAIQLFGYPRDELMASNTAAFYADPQQHETFQNEIQRKGFVKDFEVRFKKKDGSVIECLLTAHLLKSSDDRIEGHQGIIRDITAQKRAEEKIRTQNTFLTNVIESLAHPFMVIDPSDYRIKIANQAARTNQKGRGNTCYAIIHGLDEPCSRQGLRCPLEQVVKTGQPVHLEHMHSNAQGQERKHEVHAFPLFDFQGRIKQVIQYCIDITEKKRLETIAEAANLMDNLGYIFSGIRHEIGNPLNSVKMALSVLSMNLNRYPLATIREFLDRALGEISRVEYLLKALKNFSLFESPNIETVSIHQFMHNFIALVEKDFAQKGIRIQVDLPSRDMSILTDHRAFHQVLLNLLTNAADALAETEKPSINIVVSQTPGYVKVEICDNGCGITKENQSNLFRPFYTSKPEGSGLGLVIVKKMLSKMNSSIRIESTHQQGTTVTMILPQTKPQEEHDTP